MIDVLAVRRARPDFSFARWLTVFVIVALAATLLLAVPRQPDASAQTEQSVSVQISSGRDDVEQLSNGSMYFDSSDLEFVRDNNRGDQTVGLRFVSVPVPAGATITSASIEFTADENDTQGTSLTIRGEASGNAAPFAATTSNVGLRPGTSASVGWSPGAWSTGRKYATPDLAGVVQEVIGTDGWAQNNAMVFVITGSGQRVADSYEGGAAKAAKLNITYTQSGATPTSTPEPTPTPDPGSGGEERSVSVQISSGRDDVEQLSNGSMYFDSSDLEFVRDNNRGDQTVGLRFVSVPVPAGATITSASIEFTADESDTQGTSLTIRGEASGNAAAFAATTSNVGLRPGTSASVGWSPEAWSTGRKYATPDLAGVVQEVIGTDGWAQNNAMVFVVSGSGQRVADSYEGGAAKAAKLNITYTQSGAPAPTPTPEPTPTPDPGSGGEERSVSVQISSGRDDVEQLSNGSMYFDSSDLEFVRDNNRGDQTVGLRFVSVPVPAGATITSASIEFTADESDTQATSLTIRGEASGNAAAFAATTSNLSLRSATASSVSWSPQAWSTGQKYATPDLAGVVQEVIGTDGWAENNSMVFVVSGSGQRVAESYEGWASRAPVLTVSYTTGTTPLPLAPSLGPKIDGVLEVVVRPETQGGETTWVVELVPTEPIAAYSLIGWAPGASIACSVEVVCSTSGEPVRMVWFGTSITGRTEVATIESVEQPPVFSIVEAVTDDGVLYPEPKAPMRESAGQISASASRLVRLPTPSLTAHPRSLRLGEEITFVWTNPAGDLSENAHFLAGPVSEVTGNWRALWIQFRQPNGSYTITPDKAGRVCAVVSLNFTGTNLTPDGDLKPVRYSDSEESTQICVEVIDLPEDVDPGDTDCNGDLTIADALFIARMEAGLPTPTSCQHDYPAVGDVDGDGMVTIRDALFIARCVARLRSIACPDELLVVPQRAWSDVDGSPVELPGFVLGLAIPEGVSVAGKTTVRASPAGRLLAGAAASYWLAERIFDTAVFKHPDLPEWQRQASALYPTLRGSQAPTVSTTLPWTDEEPVPDDHSECADFFYPFRVAHVALVEARDTHSSIKNTATMATAMFCIDDQIGGVIAQSSLAVNHAFGLSRCPTGERGLVAERLLGYTRALYDVPMEHHAETNALCGVLLASDATTTSQGSIWMYVDQPRDGRFCRRDDDPANGVPGFSSCLRVFEGFREKYPGITLTVITRHERWNTEDGLDDIHESNYRMLMEDGY